MNKKYKDINFDVFVEDENYILTEKEQDTCITNFYKNSGLQNVLREDKQTKTRRISRKIAALSAALVIMMVFGAVAYATDLFGLGVVHNKHMSENDYETPFVEDTNQYKALAEYNAGLNKMAPNEVPVCGPIGDVKAQENQYGEVIPKDYILPDKAKAVSKTYNLKPEKSETYTRDLGTAFKQSRQKNFLGSFVNKYNVSDTNKDSSFSFGDEGSLSLHFDNSYEFVVIPKDIFPDREYWTYGNMSDGGKDIDNWEYTTEEGHKVNCSSYMVEFSPKEIEYRYDFLFTGKDNTLIMNIMIDKKNVEKIKTKGDFEKLIETLDLSIL